MSGLNLVLLCSICAFGGFDIGVLFVRWMRDGRPWFWTP